MNLWQFSTCNFDWKTQPQVSQPPWAKSARCKPSHPLQSWWSGMHLAAASPRSKPAPPVFMIVLLLPFFLDLHLSFLLGAKFSLNVKPLFWGLRSSPSFASTYTWGKSTDLSGTAMAAWSPAPCSELRHGHPWLPTVDCLMPLAISGALGYWCYFDQDSGHHLPSGWLANSLSWSTLGSTRSWPPFSAWLTLRDCIIGAETPEI